MAKKLVAMWDKVVLRPLPENETMVNGFIIPDTGKETPEYGEVISVGPGVMNVFGRFIPNTLKVGDIVLIPRVGSFNVKYRGEDYYVTREQECLAKEEDDGVPE